MAIKRHQKYYAIGFLSILVFLLLGTYINNLKIHEVDDLEVILVAKVLKDDVFQFFYIEKGQQKFEVDNSIKTKIKGSNEYQEIKFKLPKINDLVKLRLDIGSNIDQDVVLIKEIKFFKGKEEIVFGVDHFNRLFQPNIYIKKDKIPGGFKGISAVINANKIHDPYFVSKEGSKELELLTETKLTRYPYLISGFITLVALLALLLHLESISITTQKLFIVSFMLVLIAPTLQTNFNIIKPGPNYEKRTLAEKPGFTLSMDFTKRYEAYYNDNFGLRNHLINLGGAYKTKVFKSSMHPELVQFGKKDWLFYNRMKGKIYPSYSHTNLLSQDTLKKVVYKWEDNKKRYSAIGSKYFLTFWPNKHTIYPEYLPWVMQKQIKDTLSRIDQIVHYLKQKNSAIKLLDVRQTLLDAKNNNLIYHKFDTHWNDYGAFLAYQYFFNENIKALGILPKSKNDFDIGWSDSDQGELIQMLGVKNDGYFIEKNPTFTLKKNTNQIEYLPIDGYPRQTVITRNNFCGNKLKVLVFRDSFFRKLIQFFSLHFYEVTYIWGHGESYVDKIKPDIIIEGYVERDTGQKIQ